MTELLIVDFRKVGFHLNAEKTKILHSSIYDVGADKDYVEHVFLMCFGLQNANLGRAHAETNWSKEHVSFHG